MPTSENLSTLGPAVRYMRKDKSSKLWPCSRIEFNKMYEISYDIKARSYGAVIESNLVILGKQFNALYPRAKLFSHLSNTIFAPSNIEEESSGATGSSSSSDDEVM